MIWDSAARAVDLLDVPPDEIDSLDGPCLCDVIGVLDAPVTGSRLADLLGGSEGASSGCAINHTVGRRGSISVRGDPDAVYIQLGSTVAH